MTKRVLKEASVKLDLVGLESSDLESLSRILSLAGQAEIGASDEIEMSVDVDTEVVSEPDMSAVPHFGGADPEDTIAIAEPVDLDKGALGDDSESEEVTVMMDSITDEFSNIFEEMGGDMEDDFMSDIEDADDSLEDNMKEVEIEMKEGVIGEEVLDILGNGGVEREDFECRDEENTQGTGTGTVTGSSPFESDSSESDSSESDSSESDSSEKLDEELSRIIGLSGIVTENSTSEAESDESEEESDEESDDESLVESEEESDDESLVESEEESDEEPEEESLVESLHRRWAEFQKG